MDVGGDVSDVVLVQPLAHRHRRFAAKPWCCQSAPITHATSASPPVTVAWTNPMARSVSAIRTIQLSQRSSGFEGPATWDRYRARSSSRVGGWPPVNSYRSAADNTLTISSASDGWRAVSRKRAVRSVVTACSSRRSTRRTVPRSAQSPVGSAGPWLLAAVGGSDAHTWRRGRRTTRRRDGRGSRPARALIAVDREREWTCPSLRRGAPRGSAPGRRRAGPSCDPPKPLGALPWRRKLIERSHDRACLLVDRVPGA